MKEKAPNRYQYAMGYHQETDRYNAATAYVLLCIAHNKAQPEISYGDFGKPYFQQSQDNEQFSITHTNQLVAVAVSEQPVGIDSEQKSNINQDIIDVVCSLREKKQIQEKKNLAVKFWTAKESLSKLLNEDWYSTPKTDLLFDGSKIIDQRNPSVHFEYLKCGKEVLCVASESLERSTLHFVQNKDIQAFTRKYT